MPDTTILAPGTSVPNTADPVISAQKIALTTDGDDVILSLRIARQDLPAGILQAPLGSPISVTAALQPAPRSELSPPAINAMIANAAILCGTPAFHHFMGEQHDPKRHIEAAWAEVTRLAGGRPNAYDNMPPRQRQILTEGCAKALRHALGVSSRNELRTNADARNRFIALRQAYMARVA